MPTRFGTSDIATCPKCRNIMHLSRRGISEVTSRRANALEGLVKGDAGIADFIERLNYAIDDVVRKTR